LNNSHLNIVVVGHVDHGKSTLIGRLLVDTNSLPDGKLDQIKAMCERNSKPFEYAFLIDALKDERIQGITIDSARVFFKTARRHYIIIDAPGHIEFLKNMVTGASRAEAALLVIDASEGVQENSRRHGYMLSMLGIRQIAVVVNKMDLVEYRKDVFDAIVKEYSKFLESLGIHSACFIPVSGLKGDNIASRSDSMKWYTSVTILDVLDGFENAKPQPDRPFRMPVQDVYKFTRYNDTRRIIAGTITSGSLRPDDEVIFYPSGKKSRIKTIETFNAPVPPIVTAGFATGVTLQEQIYVTRGEIVTKVGEQRPNITSRMRVSLFWMAKQPMVVGKQYILKLASARVPVQIEEVTKIIDASDLSVLHQQKAIERHQVAECVLSLSRAIAFDCAKEDAAMGRFVIVDDYEIAGGGIILEAMEDEQEGIRKNVLLRNIKWEKSTIPAEVRAERYKQKPVLILITGKKNSGKKPLARALEKRLLDDGHLAYFLGIGNVLYGVDADIKGIHDDRHEHIRRLAEVSNILLDTGLILIITAIDLQPEEIELVRMTCNENEIHAVWVGESSPQGLKCDLTISSNTARDVNIEKILGILKYTRE
jgi:bifunctional enzyme CysN/CysC